METDFASILTHTNNNQMDSVDRLSYHFKKTYLRQFRANFFFLQQAENARLLRQQEARARQHVEEVE